jgi:N-acetylmuramoyl-L-alanine amidase
MKKPRAIDRIIVHVSDSPDSKNFDMFDISRWHQELRFPKSETGLFCGYHYVIKRDGTVQQARLDYEPGAHCRGFNQTSIGICWVGRNHMTMEQQLSLIECLAGLCTQYALEPKQIFGHRELNPGKTCPNIKEMDRLRDQVEIRINERAKILPQLRGA